MIKIYNTLTRKKEIFKPIKDKKVGLYSCGPTVYSYLHIGNFKTYIFSDILKRILTYNDYNVKQVMNVTDVGHLTSDADEGEDKVEQAAKKEKKSPADIANFYWKIFRDDFKKLNIIEPDIWCKATEHIQEMINLIKRMEKNGYAYVGKNKNVYFDTSKFKNYGKLAGLKVDELKAGARIEIDKNKKNPQDFVLWFSTEGSKYKGHLLKWPSPWGEGWPGWHIECSAMSIKYLGENFDIHTGGEDHISIHHTNEIAQSESATGKKFVNYWLHARWLLFKGGKMAKSKGSIYTVSDLEKKGVNPLAYRYFILTAHYRTQLSFTLDNLKKTQSAYDRLKNIISGLVDDNKINKKYLDQFEKAINDDLDMPVALSVLWNLIRDKKAEGKVKTIKEMDKIFGLDLLKKEKISIPKEVQKLIKQREDARKQKNWEKSDELREKIKKLGYWVEDTDKGSKVKKII